MAAQPTYGGSFSPEIITRMSAAIEAAFVLANDAGSPFAVIPDRELRHRIARVVVIESRRGVRDIDQLKALALRALRPLLAQEGRETLAHALQ